ncbi:hypothetical protein OROHE_009737 [Orobanche hederae]
MGGFGIGELQLRNKALLRKWWWRFHSEEDSLWYKVIKSKYGLQENNWDVGLATRTTFWSRWKFLLGLYGFYAVV